LPEYTDCNNGVNNIAQAKRKPSEKDSQSGSEFGVKGSGIVILDPFMIARYEKDKQGKDGECAEDGNAYESSVGHSAQIYGES
jgi:hypothetical protein